MLHFVSAFCPSHIKPQHLSTPLFPILSTLSTFIHPFPHFVLPPLHIRSSFVYQCQNYNIHLTTRNMIAKINTNCTVDVLSLADFADAQILWLSSHFDLADFPQYHTVGMQVFKENLRDRKSDSLRSAHLCNLREVRKIVAFNRTARINIFLPLL